MTSTGTTCTNSGDGSTRARRLPGQGRGSHRMDVAIMIEGQNGLTWPRWQRIVRAVEDLGFAGLYRSDHFTNMNPPDLDSLELWVSLAWLGGGPPPPRGGGA